LDFSHVRINNAQKSFKNTAINFNLKEKFTSFYLIEYFLLLQILKNSHPKWSRC